MPIEKEEHGAHAKRPGNDYALSGKDSITLSEQKRQDGHGGGDGVQEEGETQPAHEKDVFDGQNGNQDAKSSLRSLKLFGVKILGTSDKRQYEVETSEKISPKMEHILKELENEKKSPANEKNVRIFQKIVTRPDSVCSVFQVNTVTYVLILVESSPQDESFAASVDGHNTVFALIFDAANKRFVLVLYGDIKDTNEWKKDLHTTVYNIIFCIYGRVNQPAITDFPSNLPCLKILRALNADATEAMLRDENIRRRLAKSVEQIKLYESPPVQPEKQSVTDGKGHTEQHVQQEHGISLGENEATSSAFTTGQTLKNRKKKFHGSEITNDEQHSL